MIASDVSPVFLLVFVFSSIFVFIFVFALIFVIVSINEFVLVFVFASVAAPYLQTDRLSHGGETRALQTKPDR